MTEVQQYWRWLCGLIALVLLVSIILKIIRWFSRPHFEVTRVTYESKKGSQKMPNLLIPVNLKAKVTLTPKDSKGNVKGIDGKLVHGTSSDSSVATVVEIPESTDGLSFFVVPGDTPGQTANLPFWADALIGDGVVQISGSLDANTTDETAGSFDMAVSFEPK